MDKQSTRNTAHKNHLSKGEIIEIFQESHLKSLDKADVCIQIIDCMIEDYHWFRQDLAPIIRHRKDEKDQKVSERLRVLEQNLIERAVQEAYKGDAARFQNALNDLLTLSAPSAEGWQWPLLLGRLTQNNDALRFILHNWPVRKQLLDKASQVLSPDEPDDKEIILLLLIVEPEEFGKLLTPLAQGRGANDPSALPLPPRWNYLAIKRFVASAPAQFNAGPLGEYALLIRALAQQVHDDIHEVDKWQTLQAFFKKLAENGYADKQELLFLLLSMHPSDDVANTLLSYARLLDREALAFFQTFEKDDFLYRIPHARDLYIRLAPFHPQLKPYLFRCLQEDLQPQEFFALIEASRLDERGKATAFELAGKRYLERYPQEPVLLDLAGCSLLHFVMEAPLTRRRILEFANKITGLPQRARNRLTDAQAGALEPRIDGAARLSFIVSTLSLGLESTEMNIWHSLLYSLAERAHDAIIKLVTGAGGSSESSDEQANSRRFSAYLQFALCVDAIYDLPGYSAPDQPFGSRFLGILLQGNKVSKAESVVEGRLIDFINKKLAQYWPEDLRERWKEQERRFGPIHKGEVIRESPTVPPTTAQMPIHLPAPPAEPAAPVAPGQAIELETEKRAVLQRMRQLLSRSRGIKKLAFFWIEHRVTLIANSAEIKEDEWNTLQRAHEFYAACKEAESHRPYSLEAEKAIQRIYGHIYQNKHIFFTPGDYSRIRKAQKRVKDTTNVS